MLLRFDPLHQYSTIERQNWNCKKNKNSWIFEKALWIARCQTRAQLLFLQKCQVFVVPLPVLSHMLLVPFIQNQIWNNHTQFKDSYFCPSLITQVDTVVLFFPLFSIFLVLLRLPFLPLFFRRHFLDLGFHWVIFLISQPVGPLPLALGKYWWSPVTHENILN